MMGSAGINRRLTLEYKIALVLSHGYYTARRLAQRLRLSQKKISSCLILMQRRCTIVKDGVYKNNTGKSACIYRLTDIGEDYYKVLHRIGIAQGREMKVKLYAPEETLEMDGCETTS